MIGYREAACGSVAGFARHRRIGQEPCAACREANRQYFRDYRRRRYAQAKAEAAARRRALDELCPDELSRLPEPKQVPGAHRRAALLVCGRVTAGVDLDDPAQRAAAVDRARLLAEVLGLAGETAWRPSPGTRKQIGARAIHGTRSAVVEHQAADIPLCGPCQRWVDVQARKEHP